MNLTRFLFIGSGPASLYTVKRLLKNQNITVDMVEKGLLPGGLLRYGVAPDHPEVKEAIKLYDDMFENPSFSFYNNTDITPTLFIDNQIDLRYNCIVFGNGVEKAREVVYEGENEFKDYVVDAECLVNYYNENYFTARTMTAKQLNNLQKAKKIVIIGNGNVSMDIARLLTKKKEKLEGLSIRPGFIDLRENMMGLREIDVLARRGAVQSAFDLKELRELKDESELPVYVTKEDFEKSQDENSLKLIDIKKDIRNRARGRKFKYLNSIQSNTIGEGVRLRYFLEPISIRQNDNGKVLVCARMVYNKDRDSFVREEGKEEEIPFDFIIKSLGYTNTPNSLYNTIKQATKTDTTHIHSIGWASTGGKGKLADSYINCDQFLDSINSNSQINSTLGLSVIVSNKPCNKRYLQFRQMELNKNREIKDLDTINSFLHR